MTRPYFVDGGFRFDLPGPYTFEWTVGTAKKRGRHAREHPIPVMTGLAFAAVPYAVGAGIVIFAPPWWKPVGASMLVPGPSDPILFALGYSVGLTIEDRFEEIFD